MNDHLKGTTALEPLIGSEPDDTPPAIPAAVASNLPPNEPNGDLAISSPSGATVLAPDSTGPPNMNDYWFGLIPERTAAEFLGLTVRWMQSKRQHGNGVDYRRHSTQQVGALYQFCPDWRTR